MSDLISGLFGTGLSALTGAFSNSPANKTTTTNSSSNQNQSQTQSASGSSTYAQNLNPAQTQVLSPLASTITSVLSNPSAYVAPSVNQQVNQVNDNYSGLAQTLRQQFLQTGGGSSGKYGTAVAQGDLARLGQISTAQNTGAQEAAQLPLSASSIAEGLLGLNFGGTTSNTGTSTATGSSSSSSSGTQVGPGSTVAGALQGGTSSLLANPSLLQSVFGSMTSSAPTATQTDPNAFLQW